MKEHRRAEGQEERRFHRAFDYSTSSRCTQNSFTALPLSEDSSAPALRGCHGSILGGHVSRTPVTASPCLPQHHFPHLTERVCPITSRMFNDVAPVDRAIDIYEESKTCQPQTRAHRNVSGEGTSTLNPGSSSKVIGVAHGLTHTEQIGSSLDKVQGPQAVELQIDSLSRGPADENRDRGTGGVRSSDHLPSEPGSEDFCPIHGLREDNWKRLTTMVDPLLAVIFQGVCALLAYESSSGSSMAGDVMYYVLVFVCVLGFVFAFFGKWLSCLKMEAIGLLFAGVGFLLTMVLAVIYKIG